ncbi:E3 ubiquitin-protein ligase ZFP91 isoform X2 [Calonectris borealis]|uniref:E3 ubiquitin-protein ligase ZFP91 isoform X2 n=1 Tax=Calonectris borealis TaxID=1323832 RepID=UPI003F4BFFD2
MPAGTEQPGGAEEQPPAQGPPAAAERPPSSGRRRPPPPAAEQGEESGGSRVLRGGRERGRAAAAASAAGGAAAAAAASRRRKAEYPRRRRSSPGARPAAEQPTAETPPAAKKAPRAGCTDKAAGKGQMACGSELYLVTSCISIGQMKRLLHQSLHNPKEEKEEEEVSSVLSHGSPVSTARPSRSWRSSRSATAARQRDTENSRASRSKTGSLRLVCKSEPNTDHLEYEVTEEHQSPAGISDDEEEMLISEEEVPFKDDPRDETYKPHLEKEAPKQRRKASKGKEEKEKQKEIKVEVKEESEFQEDEEPPRKRGRRRKDDKSPRLPKRRKKPPIQYVRCEMEGCGTVLAHPRYLQHHIKYQHLLKKKYVCPHPSCGRLFRLQKQLLRHAKHHTDQRDYICEYCARAFKSSHNLAVHRMIHTGEKPLQCEICGFTCRQKASLNWHMKKHDADSFYQFSCNICGKKFEKKDSVVAHKAKSHPEVLIAEALAANAGALITSTDILGTNPEAIAPPADGQGLPLLPDPLASAAPADCLLLNPDGMPKTYCGGAERVSLVADGKLFVGSGSSTNAEGLVMNTEILGATTEVLIEDSDSTGP